MKIIVGLLIGAVAGFLGGIYACPYGTIYMGKNSILTRTVVVGSQIDDTYARHSEVSHSFFIGGGLNTFKYRVSRLFTSNNKWAVEEIHSPLDDEVRHWFDSVPDHEDAAQDSPNG